MRLTQGSFSFLPDLTPDEVALQVQYALDHDWPVSIEYSDDPHPRNVYWQMWGLPLFDLRDPAGVMREVEDCCKTFPNHYVRILAYDARLGRETVAMMFLVQRPEVEPGFELVRTEGADRQQRYGVRAYSAAEPSGSRYRPGS